MLIDAIDIIADWLAHATHGVNAGLAAAPITSGYTRALPLTLLRETVDDAAGTLQAPDTLPALVVNSAGTLEQGPIAVRPFPADGQVELVLRHIVLDAVTVRGLQALDQGARAIKRSMGRLFSSQIAGTETARVRNNVQLTSIRSYRAELYRGNEDAILTMAHTYTLDVRDTWATT